MSYKITPDLAHLSLNETDTVKSIVQNVAIILSTLRGSCPLYRAFGISRQYIDKPIPVAEALMFSDVKETIEEYEPRVRVTDISFEVSETEPGRLLPTVTVEVIDDES